MTDKVPDFNKITALIGIRGSGKTPYIKGAPEHNIYGLIRTYLDRDMKTLIIDTIDHPSYRDINFITFDELRYWDKGVYRIQIRPDEMNDFSLYLNELHSLYNSFIVFEDAYKLTGSEKLSKPMKTLMVDTKQKNIDMILLYHYFAQTPLDLFRNVDLIELFKTKDDPSCRKDSLPGIYEEVEKIYQIVKAHPSRFYHKTIDLDQ